LSDFTEREETLISTSSRTMEERGLVADVLCSRCSHGIVFRRRGRVDVVAHCRVMECDVPTDIAECTDFHDPREMPMYQMLEIALPVDTRVGVRDGAYA
jgi:hypothetical protein